MRMLKLKMRAQNMKTVVAAGDINRTSSFTREYVELPGDTVRVALEVCQAEVVLFLYTLYVRVK